MSLRLIRAGHRSLTRAWPVKVARSVLERPIATISFDDFPHDAWSVGGTMLEDYGARGTYFVSAGFSPAALARGPAAGCIAGTRYYDLDDLIAAHERGHEIGCHTAAHVHVTTLDNVALVESLRNNADFVRALVGDITMTSFAFPQGAVDVRTKRLCGRHFEVCRGTRPGLNHGLIDLALLRAIPLNAFFEWQVDLGRLIARAQATRAWIVFYGHDVCKTPSPWGSRPRTLERLLTALRRADIDIVTLREGVTRLHGSVSDRDPIDDNR